MPRRGAALALICPPSRNSSQHKSGRNVQKQAAPGNDPAVRSSEARCKRDESEPRVKRRAGLFAGAACCDIS
jgi:hypothetical protein